MLCKAIYVWALAAAAVAADDPAYFADLEPPPEERYGGGEMVAAGGYLPLPASAFPGTVRVLDGEVLRNRGYLYLGSALAEEAGVYVEYIPGREGVTMSPRFRGSTGREVLILLDGVPYNQLPTGWAYLKSVPLEGIARVEVLQGPASWRWGDRALAGVINVVTMQGPREAARALVSASDGTFNSERYRCNFGLTTHGVDVFASGDRILDYEPSNSYHNPLFARESQANVDGRVGYRWGGDAELNLVAGHYGGYEKIVPVRAVVQTGTYLPKQQSWDDRIRLYGMRKWGQLEGRVTAYRHTGRTRLEGDAGASAEENAGSASLTWCHAEGSGLTLEAGGGNRSAPDTGEAVTIASGRLLEEYRPGFPVYLAAGGGYDVYAPGEGAFSPRAALAWFPKPSFKVYGSYSGGVRLPAPAELGRDERVGRETGYESGFRFYAPGHVEFGGAYFGNRGKDLYLDAEDAWVETAKGWKLRPREPCPSPSNGMGATAIRKRQPLPGWRLFMSRGIARRPASGGCFGILVGICKSGPTFSANTSAPVRIRAARTPPSRRKSGNYPLIGS